ncbi:MULTISPECIES: hypothetical protein [unclassified Streptomyces]|uniref:hypothetical protein n=1 Tax=unclassified Streptomyces TaxID=2593676 RepID=UPI002259099D|nr:MULTISPECIES: hypothetical protein [unclassified Streptomyces]MCX5443812.1 hypothetical protein [Streptomyces sp. NBC_00063]WUB90851.1 hypothetical protein OHO83_00035 [Streptomyces sp. NBC_00569]WUB99188.1 hypothetical protein OHO83_46855 [Streptomyces sp. NBC_00569]
MTVRRVLGSGPQAARTIRASQADLIDALPGIRLPDVAELRARGVVGGPTETGPAPRRTLGAGRRVDEESSA